LTPEDLEKRIPQNFRDAKPQEPSTAIMASKPFVRERRPSIGVPVADLQGPVGPGFSRPKHKRTFTGFGPSEIKAVEASIPEPLRAA
jgi:hypothetical protein